MDQWLAEVYGTNNDSSEVDLEKTAQMHLLAKLAEEQGVDISGLDEEQLNALAEQVLDGEQAEPQQQQGQVLQQQFQQPQQGYVDPAQQQELLAKEAQAKFEEADFLGRIMAHSYTQELEKIASSKTAGRFGAVAGKAMSAGKKGLDSAKGHVSKNKGRYAAGAAGAGGFAAGRASKSKEASAFNKLAEMRAAEILEQSGIDPATGTPVNQGQPHPMIPQQQQGQMGQGQQPGQPPQGAQPGQVSPEEQFGAALDERALEILQQAGYDITPLLAAQQGQDQQ